MLDDRWFEDYIPGRVQTFGSVLVKEEEIIEFAEEFDPQPFHLDKNRAKQSAFGGLVASGWHTASLTMRLIVDNYLSAVSSEGSPGVDELRWLAPVRPGDRLSIRVTISDVRRSRTNPKRGIVRSQIETINQDKLIVMRFFSSIFIKCREGELST